MRTIKTKVYKFDELSLEAQKKAVEKHWEINVNYEWWEFVYEDAERIGLKITAFDIDRGSYCKGEVLSSCRECAELIKQEHGEQCETYKTAVKFLADWDNEVAKHSDGLDTDRVAEDKEYEFDKIADELEDDFLKSLLEDYRIILQKEYEYLTSEESIIESIRANEMEFLEDGKPY